MRERADVGVCEDVGVREGEGDACCIQVCKGVGTDLLGAHPCGRKQLRVHEDPLAPIRAAQHPDEMIACLWEGGRDEGQVVVRAA